MLESLLTLVTSCLAILQWIRLQYSIEDFLKTWKIFDFVSWKKNEIEV